MKNENKENLYINYIIGFLLSLILTITSFYTVISNILPKRVNQIFILILAVIQMIIQLIYFFKIKDKKNLNLISLLFTMIIILIITLGTFWIMFNLYNMMMVF